MGLDNYSQAEAGQQKEKQGVPSAQPEPSHDHAAFVQDHPIDRVSTDPDLSTPRRELGETEEAVHRTVDRRT